jgi:pimeloyl-ACP methyl ester carboxylesterase
LLHWWLGSPKAPRLRPQAGAPYLTDSALREAARDRVRALIGPDTTVVVAHSLGTVVAYEALCSLPGHRVRELVTLGSPLGVRNLIFDGLLPPPTADLGSWPGTPATRWTNIADARDVVALVEDLRPRFGPDVSCHRCRTGGMHTTPRTT